MAQSSEEDKYIPLYDQQEWEQLHPSRPKRTRLADKQEEIEDDRRIYTLTNDPEPSSRPRRRVTRKNAPPDYARDERSVYSLEDDPEPPRPSRKQRRYEEKGEPPESVHPRTTAGKKAETAYAAGETPDEQPDATTRRKRFEDYVGQVLSGNILTRAEVRRHYPYVFFMAFLMFLYIANGYHIQKLHRRHDRLNAQIKELRSRSLTMTSIRMTTTRQSEIIKQLEARGIPLQESLVAPKVVEK